MKVLKVNFPEGGLDFGVFLSNQFPCLVVYLSMSETKTRHFSCTLYYYNYNVIKVKFCMMVVLL